MRRHIPIHISLAILVLSALPAPIVAQERSPEVQNLDYWVGDWSYVLGDGSGQMKFWWFGDLLIQASETTPNGSEVVHMMGYDPEKGVYRWHRYFNNGYTDAAVGWYHDNSWVFLFDEPAGRRRRATMREESPGEMSFTWERSVEGGPWEVTGQGRSTRVR